MKYTLLWIPRSGLFYDGGVFLDGNGHRVRWERKITIFKSHARAERAKNRVLKKFPDAKGELILIPVSIGEAEDGE